MDASRHIKSLDPGQAWKARASPRRMAGLALTPLSAILSAMLSAALLGLVPGPAVAASLGDMFSALTGGNGDYGRGRDLNDALRRLAAQMNRSMPQDIDKEFRLDRVTAEPGAQLVYHYTLRERRAADVPPAVLNQQMAPAVRQRLCRDPQMSKLLDSGAGVSYSYRGSDGIEIGKLSFRQQDCITKG